MAKKKKQARASWKIQLLIVVGLIGGILFSALAVILLIGMIPSIVSLIVDRTKGKSRTMTVAAVNFAGCTPFLVEVFLDGNDMSTAIEYILEPRTIVVMYLAAGMGYLIDWAMTGIVSSIMVQKAKGRLREIEKQKKEMIERWGPEVTGTMPLDQYGFPIDLTEAKPADE